MTDKGKIAIDGHAKVVYETARTCFYVARLLIQAEVVGNFSEVFWIILQRRSFSLPH